jgi:hypothetical protein
MPEQVQRQRTVGNSPGGLATLRALPRDSESQHCKAANQGKQPDCDWCPRFAGDMPVVRRECRECATAIEDVDSDWLVGLVVLRFLNAQIAREPCHPPAPRSSHVGTGAARNAPKIVNSSPVPLTISHSIMNYRVLARTTTVRPAFCARVITFSIFPGTSLASTVLPSSRNRCKTNKSGS